MEFREVWAYRYSNWVRLPKEAGMVKKWARLINSHKEESRESCPSSGINCPEKLAVRKSLKETQQTQGSQL